jgi:fused signal recognition particle receptor
MQEPKQPDNQGQDTQDSQDKGSWKDKFKTGFAKAFGRDHPEADSPPASGKTPDAADDSNWKNKLKQTFSFGQSEAPSSTTSAPAPSTPPEVVTPSAAALPEEQVTATPAPVAKADNGGDTAGKGNWKERLRAGLSKTRTQLGTGFKVLFRGRKIDEDLYEELETVLLTADVGVDATTQLLEEIRTTVKKSNLDKAEELKSALQQSMTALIQPLQQPLDISGHKPFIIMLAGVNGAGKTTSIGKLAKYFQSQGKSVLLAAGDTFRAAAKEQLLAWGERNNVTVISQESGDSAAVIFDAINAARARNIDVVLADTAGRLPTQLNLMEEIKKVKRVIQKADPSGPHEVLLVLDANTGQNAVTQVKAFDDALGLTGLIVSKLDGTAKGGVIAAIAKQRPIPLRFIGVGEQLDDLRPFIAADYVEALFD